MVRIALVVAYLIGMTLGVYAMDQGDDGLLAVIWIVGSIVLGAATGDIRYALLAVLTIPIAIPFGNPADTSSDPVLPVWIGAMYLALISAVLIVFATFAREAVDSRLQRRRARRDSGVT
jgi:hypothetical protein